MIISKTPFRISFFGGGTDYPAWYLKEGGAVLSTTIDKYCYITCRVLPPFYEVKYRVVWSHIEAVSTISEILHPAVREGLKYLNINGDLGGLEIHHQGDLPARAGMGSSSSFVVGLFRVLAALKGQIVSRYDLVRTAIDFEQSVLKENVGSQDQVAAGYGGFNLIHFCKNGEIRVEPVTISTARITELESNLMLLYTGTSRLSSEVAGDFILNIEKKADVLRKMRAMVDQALSILAGQGSISEFGTLLNESWELKRSISDRVSNPIIDKIYDTAVENGALGGKLLGAGSSGFMLLFAPPDKQQRIKDALPGYLHVPFKFESEGSTIIYYSRRDQLECENLRQQQQ
ncbi:MAG: GHMP family kinase ATP-binding protein [Methanosarcinaceae archaeon]